MNLLEMSFSGAVFIIAVFIIRTAAVYRLPKMTFVLLWETVLLRLLILFRIPFPFSVHTLISLRVSTPPSVEAQAIPLPPATSQRPPLTLQEMEHLASEGTSVSARFVVWCAGMILLASFFALAYLRCRMEFRTALPVNNAYAERWLKECPLKRRVFIRQSDRISTPLTYGIFRPVILMPRETDWEREEQLRYIFSHEYAHICRFDALTKLIAAFALCIHWFNPLVWVMYRLFNRDLELACDERVIKQAGQKQKSAYSLMLIGMEAQKSRLMPFGSGLAKNPVEERITAIMKTKPATPFTLLSACFLVLISVSAFATSAAASTDDRPDGMPAANVASADAGNVAPHKKNFGSIIHESADILHYEDGAPYIHDILTNNTDKTIVETQYCMLACDEDGAPLKLYWNFTDSSAESSYENIVRSEENLLPGQTENYRGGWSLYDGGIMKDFPGAGDGEASRAAWALLCLKQVVFEDGAVWDNPDYESWLKTHAGQRIGVDELQNYYPHEYRLEPAGWNRLIETDWLKPAG